MSPYRRAWLSALLAVLATIYLLNMPATAGLPDIYPAPDRAKADLSAALTAALAYRKRIILDFGGNWCADCHVLDHFLHDSTNEPLLEAHYVLVHINIGRVNENLDIAERYQIPLRKGVPALAILGEHGELLYSQRAGEFQAMRLMQASAVTDFLLHWRRPD